MNQHKKLLAEIFYLWSRKIETLQVDGEKEAVEQCLSRNAYGFTISEPDAESGTNGQASPVSAVNQSGPRYVGFDRIYTTAEVISIKRSTPCMFGKDIREAVIESTEYFEEKTPGLHFFAYPDGSGDFHTIGQNEKVFNRQGQQVWPLNLC